MSLPIPNSIHTWKNVHIHCTRTCINFSKYISKINCWVHKTTPPPPYVSYSQKIIKLFINHTNVKVPDACISLCNKLPLIFSNSLCWETLILNSSTVITALSKLLGSSVEAAILEKNIISKGQLINVVQTQFQIETHGACGVHKASDGIN